MTTPLVRHTNEKALKARQVLPEHDPTLAHKTKAKAARAKRKLKAKNSVGRSPLQIEADRVTIAQMYLQGHTQAAIATKMKLTEQTIWKTLKDLRQEWQSHASRAFATMEAEELSKLDVMERELWQAWEKSKEDAIALETHDGESSSKQIKKVKSQAGDPEYLRGVLSCMESRAKRVGLYAPKEVHVSNRQSRPIEQMTTEELYAIVGKKPGEVVEGDFQEAEPEGAA